MKFTLCFILFSLGSLINFNVYGQNGKEPIVNLWPKGVAIPYEVSNQYGISGTQIIRGALLQIMKGTCIRFVPRTNNEADYIVFMEYKAMSQESGTCWTGKWSNSGSPVLGNQNGRHIVSLWRNRGCFNRYNIIKAVFQILGFPPKTSSDWDDEYYENIYETLLGENNLSRIQSLYSCSSIDMEKISLPSPPGQIGTGQQCEDTKHRQNGSQCPGWAEVGECSKNPNWMLPNCKASCKQCGTSPVREKGSEQQCKDSTDPKYASNCRWWAKVGECSKNPDFMLINCHASCKKCNKTETYQSECKDFFPIECPVWAATDQCEISPWVVENCKFSCKQCSKDLNSESKLISSATEMNLTKIFFNSNPVNPNCTKEAQLGTCDSDPAYMKSICNESYCEKSKSCTDKDKRNCPLLAYKGECERNPTMMQERCKGSCNTKCFCEDSFPECPIWAAKGHCQLKPKKLLFICKRSCKNCEFCKDRNPNCPKMASIGNCTANLDYMILNCAKSCKLCYSSD